MIDILITGLGLGYGGVESVILNVLRNLNREEFDATIVLSGKSVLEEEIKSLGYSCVNVTPFGNDRLKYRKEIEEVFANHKYDYVWVNKSSKVNVDIFKIAKKYGVKTIAHSHGSFLECASKLRYLAIKVAEKFTSRTFYKNVDVPMACSRKAGEYLFSAKYRKMHDVNIILNTIDVEKFKFDRQLREKVRSELGIDENQKVMIAVGRLVSIKNPFFMVRLLSELPDNYILILIGTGDKEEEIKENIKLLGLEKRVHMLGARSDVNVLLNGADIFILPSFHEGFPVSAIEAQTNGLQCIISDSITDEAVVLDNCRNANIENIEEWKRIISDVCECDRESCAKEMKARGFDNKSYAEKFMSVLKNELVK